MNAITWKRTFQNMQNSTLYKEFTSSTFSSMTSTEYSEILNAKNYGDLKRAVDNWAVKYQNNNPRVYYTQNEFTPLFNLYSAMESKINTSFDLTQQQKWSVRDIDTFTDVKVETTVFLDCIKILHSLGNGTYKRPEEKATVSKPSGFGGFNGFGFGFGFINSEGNQSSSSFKSNFGSFN